MEKITSKNLNIKLKNLLNKRGFVLDEEIDKFLNPKLSDMLDPMKLTNMNFLKSRLTQAITQNETIVIYGDYDADGICASTILYKYFKSKNLSVNVVIPRRYEDGYGLKKEVIDDIADTYYPDLLITVDCGITAIDEVEYIKELGIDVIVNDHHEPLNELTACIVVDPKIDKS
ncbi:MAG: DHH family phosphoesterase, partial [Clostridia bacterium]